MRVLAYSFALLLCMPFAQAQNRTLNKGAAVPPDVLNQYEARDFHGMPYRFLLPENYDAKKQYPLILSLHGAGGVGNDNETQMRNWTATFVDPVWRAKYPCIVVCPQSEESWTVDNEPAPDLNSDAVKKLPESWRKRIEARGYSTPEHGPLTKALQLTDMILVEYAVDPNRVYVLGHSMGGFGTWNAIWSAPGRFAAAMPSAGGLQPWKDYSRFKDVPTWTFHGNADPTVPIEYTRFIFDFMKQAGGNLKFTEAGGVKHNVVNYAFAPSGRDIYTEVKSTTHYSSDRCDKTENVWDWLFAQRLDKR